MSSKDSKPQAVFLNMGHELATTTMQLTNPPIAGDAFVNTRPRHTQASTQVTFTTTHTLRPSAQEPMTSPTTESVPPETSFAHNDSLLMSKQDRPLIYNMQNIANLKTWNIKFNGDSCVYEFLNRVEETRVARDVDITIVLRGFSELLQGTALQYYRLIKHKIFSWEDLCREFKQSFQPLDFEYTTEKTIRETKQKHGQSMFAFVISIKDLNSRLVNPITDHSLLEIIKHNLLPSYASLLANNKITDLDQLLALGRNYEAYVGKTIQTPTTTSNTYPNETVTCLKCKRRGHNYKQCRSIRGIVCFKCGTPDVYTSSCPKCTGPNTNFTPPGPSNRYFNTNSTPSGSSNRYSNTHTTPQRATYRKFNSQKNVHRPGINHSK